MYININVVYVYCAHIINMNKQMRTFTHTYVYTSKLKYTYMQIHTYIHKEMYIATRW